MKLESVTAKLSSDFHNSDDNIITGKTFYGKTQWFEFDIKIC